MTRAYAFYFIAWKTVLNVCVVWLTIHINKNLIEFVNKKIPEKSVKLLKKNKAIKRQTKFWEVYHAKKEN